MSVPVESVLARTVVIRSEHARAVLGSDLAAGMVLATGLVLQVERDEEARDVRLEMVGADIHYVAFDEPVTVLARVTDEVLDAVAVGVFVARAEQRRRPVLTRVAEKVRSVAASTLTRTGKANRGRLDQYEDDVEHYRDTCPIHGETTFARHKVGFRAGRQRYKRRCLKCHTDYNLDHRGVGS